jgi:ABC-type multidrug transport system fused ATPase/permease subunit
LEEGFARENEKKIDQVKKSSLPNIVSSMWLSIRLEMLGNIIILFAGLFTVIGRYTLDPGLVGLSLTYATNSTSILNRLIGITSQVETSMVSVERVKEYQDEIPQEAPYYVPQEDPPKPWPEHGSIVLHKYMTKYREGLDVVLKNITCNIKVIFSLHIHC